MSTVTYRPNAAGSNTNIAAQYPASGEHWDKVDEESSDGLSTYIYAGSVYQLDTYNFPNPSEEGTINSITLHFLVRCNSGDSALAKAAIYIGSTTYYGAEESITSTSFTEFTKTWNTNPATSAAWEWSDLNTLEIGIAMNRNGGAFVACTQLYLVIDYSGAGGFSYAKVVGI